MAVELKYNEKLRGAKAVAKIDGAQVFDGLIEKGIVYSAKKGDYYYTTGYYYQVDYVQYLQTTTGLYVCVNYMQDNLSWVLYEGSKNIPSYGVSQAQKLVNTIIANNKKIISNNLLCARFANKLSETEREQVVSLQNRLQVRNEALQAGGLTNNVRTSYPAGYAELSAYLDALMRSEAIGIATWVVVVIAATVIAATATAAYFAYKSLADESEKDVKFSDSLTRTLTSKLTDEEYQQLLQETKGIVTKARVKQALGSYWNVLQIVAFAIAGYAGYKLFKNYVQE